MVYISHWKNKEKGWKYIILIFDNQAVKQNIVQNNCFLIFYCDYWKLGMIFKLWVVPDILTEFNCLKALQKVWVEETWELVHCILISHLRQYHVSSEMADASI